MSPSTAKPRRPGGTAARPQSPRCGSGGADSPGRTRCLRCPAERRRKRLPRRRRPERSRRESPHRSRRPGRRGQRASLGPAPALPACPPHAPAAAALPPRGSPARPGSSSSFLSALPPSLPSSRPPSRRRRPQPLAGLCFRCSISARRCRGPRPARRVRPCRGSPGQGRRGAMSRALPAPSPAAPAPAAAA